MKLIRSALLVFFLICFSTEAFSQFYLTQNRPAGQNWQEMKTPHFRIIYAAGDDSLARATGMILESQYATATALAGGSLSNFPVILTNYNDITNGFVSSSNFRMEVELSPFKGKGISPTSGEWLEAVLPHELVHASQFNVTNPVSIPGVIRILSPDFSRFFNIFPQVGVHEGLAVYQETHEGLDNAGRGHLAFFNNQYNANLVGSNAWSMGQTFQPSSNTRPFNRHYIAGYTFTNWLHEKYGENASKNAIRFQHSYFFLGYGVALKKVTGKWPHQLHAEYLEDKKAEEDERLNSIPKPTIELQQVLESGYRGQQMRKPLWLSENQLVYYGAFYNAVQGFYSYDLSRNKTKLLKEAITIRDYNYGIVDESTLLYGTYTTSKIYSTSFKADLASFDLSSGKSTSLTTNLRLFSPTKVGNRILALQVDGSSSNIVELRGDNTVSVLKRFNDSRPVGLSAKPGSSQELAVVQNKRGVQALWFTTLDDLSSDLNNDPDIAFNKGSITDPHWHPSGNKVLFTVDAYPAMNVYEYDLRSKELVQVTQSLYNAFEASYSPSGDRIAYVIQKDNEQLLATLDRSDFANIPVSQSSILQGQDLATKTSRPRIGSELLATAQTWNTSKYRTNVGWLKPRAAFPVFYQASGSTATQWGVAMFGADALQSHSYNAEITGVNDKLYYDFRYQNKSFMPGFGLKLSSSPTFGTLRDGEGNLISATQISEEFELSTSHEIFFRRDTRFSSLTITPGFATERLRNYTLRNEPLSNYFSVQSVSLTTQYFHNILTNPRDVQPSEGLGIYSIFEQDVKTDFSSKRASAFFGALAFVSPLKKFNQSLRIDLSFLSQTSNGFYSNSTIVPTGFSESNIFPDAENLGRFSTRYTIPIAYPDKGWMLLPTYFNSVYLALFSHTISDLNSDNLYNSSRTVIGAGLNFSFNFSNIPVTLSIGAAFEPTRNHTELIFGVYR